MSRRELQSVSTQSAKCPRPDLIRVYRFQDAAGYGPYSGRGFRLWENAYLKRQGYAHYVPNHPGPDEDGLGLWGDQEEDGLSWYFGFASVGCLDRWFPDPDARLAMLEANGCRPWVFEVDRQWVRHGTHQCVFKRDMAKVIGPLCPARLELVSGL